MILYLLSVITANAQSVAINNSGTPPDSSAVPDINSSHKGLLIPGVHLLSVIDSVTIQHPAVSLLIYNTNKQLPKGAGCYAKADAGKAPAVSIDFQGEMLVKKGEKFVLRR